MWRRRGSFSGFLARNNNNSEDSPVLRTSISSSGRSSTFYGHDDQDRSLVFSLEVPTPGPLGLDLRARHVERDKPQRGAYVKGFRRLAGDEKGYVEQTGRVKVGDILETIHTTKVDDMPFDQIVKLASQLQKDETAWPLRLEFCRQPAEYGDKSSRRARSSSFFRAASSLNPAQDKSFNEKLQYFRGFFASRLPTGGTTPKEHDKDKVPSMPAAETVNEMYRDLLVKRDVPEDVLEELVRIETLETKWHVVWYGQVHENNSASKNQADSAEAGRMAEALVELKWDGRGLKVLDKLRSKMSVASTEWIESFLANFGLDYLSMKLPDPSPFSIEQHRYDRATRICEVILRTLRTITHFPEGVEALTRMPGLVNRVALCFHTESGDLKKCALQLLGIVCYNSAEGHQTVIAAFDHYKEAKGEQVRFGCLRDALKSTRYSLVFKEEVLSFVNVIVNKAIRLEDRLEIRADFMALKMPEYFEEIRAKSLAVQRKQSEMSDSPLENSSPMAMARLTPQESPEVRASAKTLLSPVPVANGGSPPVGRAATPSPRPGKSQRLRRRRVQSSDYGALVRSSSKSAPASPADSLDSVPSSPAPSICRSSLASNFDRPSTPYSYSNTASQLRSQLDNMEKQIDVFERFMEDDRKDTIYDETDLSDVESVFRSLRRSVSNDAEVEAAFLSLLQQLLLIPADRVIGKEMWGLSEKLMKQVAHLTPVEEVRNFELGYDDRKALLQMRDRYTRFLEKCAEEDPSFRYRMGTIIVLDNQRPEDELTPSEDTAEETDEEDLPPDSIMAKDHPDLSKYFKLLKMGTPKAQVQERMKHETRGFDVAILDTPERTVPVGEIMDITSTPVSVSSEPQAKVEEVKVKGTRAEEHDKYKKFFKLLKMGMPTEHVELKMSSEGLDGAILSTPDVLLDEEGQEVKEEEGKKVEEERKEEGVCVKDHPKFSKFFKLLKMGMPMEHVKLKASSEGLNTDLLDAPDTRLDEEGNVYEEKEDKQGTPVKDHAKFSKFFKLLKMGMPMEHVKLKASSEGLNTDLLDTPDALLDEEGNPVGSKKEEAKGVPVKEHEKFAKFFKLMKMGMPLEQVKLKASAEGFDASLLDSPDTLLDEEGKPVTSGKEVATGTPVKEHEKFAKFFKLMKMGMPLEQVKLKASAEGFDANLLDTPDTLLDEEGKPVGASEEAPKGTRVKEHEKFAKFFKLLKMGMPTEQVKLKASAEGLNADLIDTPDALVDEDGKPVEASSDKPKGTPVKEHEKFTKFFKLMKMGMPLEQVKLKASAEGLNADLLDTPDKLVDEEGKPVEASSEEVKGTPAKEHEKFAKFFKLMKMGMPLEQAKLKASAAGLDESILETPDKLLDEDGKPAGGAKVQVKDHPSYAKYFKLMKMGMPLEQAKLKASAEGLDGALLETPDKMIAEDGGSGPKESAGPPKPKAPPKPKLRNLYWEAVKEEEVGGTIWDEVVDPRKSEEEDKEDAAPVNPLFAQLKAKKTEEEEEEKPESKLLETYVKKLEEVFVNKPPKAKASEGKKSTKKKTPARVALIDVKRANNIGIMLARFRLPYHKVRNAVLTVDKEILSSERVSSLIQFCPEKEELETVQAYTGDPKLLGDAEQFFRELLYVPRLETRLKAIHATWQFDSYVSEQKKLMESISSACQELQNCGHLKEIFKVVLSLGNALNDGTARGGAKGFRLSILLKLNQVKASDNSTTLLNYVAKVLREKDPAILEFDKELPSIESASRVTQQVLTAGEAAVRKAATAIIGELDAHAKLTDKDYVSPPTPATEEEKTEEDEDEEKKVASDRFQAEIGPFAQRAKEVSEEVAQELETTNKQFEDTARFFSEDPTSKECGPDAFFNIFYSFAKVLQTADRDNERKRIAEERRIRREEETKKRLEKLKNKKKQNSYAALKTGDVDDIVKQIRSKRTAEKRQGLASDAKKAEEKEQASPAKSPTQARESDPTSTALVRSNPNRAVGNLKRQNGNSALASS